MTREVDVAIIGAGSAGLYALSQVRRQTDNYVLINGGELGTTYFLPRMVGIARASEILMTGRTVGAEEADRIGMLTRLVPAEALMETAMETARQMLEKSARGLRLTKETIRQNLDAPCLENAVELENRNQSMLCTAPEFFEAIAKFKKSHE